MKNKPIQRLSFLPRVIFLMGLMLFSFLNLSLASHGMVLFFLYVYERTFLESNLYKRNFLKEGKKYFIVWVYLFVFYAIFLQTGQEVLFTVNLPFSIRWDIYLESIIYALHFNFLFMETYWVAYLLHREKKLYSLQVLFSGSLYVVTLIWNGALHQIQALLEKKIQFEESLVARGKKLNKIKQIHYLLEYVVMHSFKLLRQKAPSFSLMWRVRSSGGSLGYEIALPFIAMLVLFLHIVQDWLVLEYYWTIQVLLLSVGILILIQIVTTQACRLTDKRIIPLPDAVMMTLMILWALQFIFSGQAWMLTGELDIASLRLDHGIAFALFLVSYLCFRKSADA